LLLRLFQKFCLILEKAKLRGDSLEKLDKVSDVLKTTVKDLDVGIEGHTDNVPIKYSGWKSNWELSSQRALSVLHYLEKKNISPKKIIGNWLWRISADCFQ